jgi:hypothetical protein
MKLAFALLSCLLFSSATNSLAQSPANITVNIIHDQSSGLLRVNGVPIHRFGGKRPADSGPLTDAVGVAQWLVEGENVIAVEVTAAAGSSTQIVVVRGMDEPKLFDDRVAGSGKAQYKLALHDVPRWGWFTADPWAGDDKELLAAIAALHAAFAKGDVKTVVALYQPFEDDLKPYAGSMLEGAEEGLAGNLKGALVLPLPAGLKVERFYGDRLFVVEGPGGAAPVTVMNESLVQGAPALQAGRYWIRKQGRWMVIRP